MRFPGRDAWVWLACGLAAIVGVFVGRWIYGVGTLPNLAAMFAIVAWMVVVAGLGVLVGVGLVLMALRERDAGGIVMLLAASVGLGAFICYLLIGYGLARIV